MTVRLMPTCKWVIATAILAAAGVAAAQGFPTKAIQIITPFAPGNTLDTALRVMADPFRDSTGQPLIIDNRPGGAGFIAANAAATATPDGYTLMLGGSGMMAMNPHTRKSLPYDPVKSYKPVSNFLGSALVFAVHPDVPAKTLAEFVDYAKKNPQKTTFASYTAGNASHFAGVILNKRAGIDMLHVPYNGTPTAVTNLLGGQVHSGFLPMLALKQHLEAGRVRVLAITSDERSPLLPDVPTFAELGYKDLTFYVWAGLFAPADTPDEVVDKLSAEISKALRTSHVGERFQAMGFVPLPSTPKELASYMSADSQRWKEAVELSGFEPQ